MWGPNYEQDKIEGEDLELVRSMCTNTLAVLTNAPEHRAAIRSDLVAGRDALRKMWGEQKMTALADALIGLIDSNGDPRGLGENLKGDYRKAWQTVIAAVARLRSGQGLT